MSLPERPRRFPTLAHVRGGDAPPSLTDQAFSRAAGARRIEGNAVRLLRDAEENYPAWLASMESAERYILFESYIIRDDRSGRQFADLLSSKARAGVAVHLLYDWLGALGKTSRRFWAALRDAGIEVRCFNPFRITSPFGWVNRDHRKSLIVDGEVAFVTGLCVGDEWAGDPAAGVPAWRDTGIELRGPAVAAVERAFSTVWNIAGPPISATTLQARADAPPAGDVAVRIVASEPNRGGLLRLDQLIAAAARETLWLTDAYYAGIPSQVESLRAAALDGVDVRLLVPGATDIPILRPLSRAGYRPLLEAGIRVFEWNGPMIHAKTSVADGRWARVGSSNLNIASWLGNYELDAVIEDHAFAQLMAEQYERDLTNATEVVLRERRRFPRRPALSLPAARAHTSHRPPGRRTGSSGRAAAGAIRLGNTISAAVTNRRVLAPPDAGVVAMAGLVLVVLAGIAVYWPRLLSLPLAVLFLWLGGALLLRAARLRSRRRVTPATKDG